LAWLGQFPRVNEPNEYYKYQTRVTTHVSDRTPQSVQHPPEVAEATDQATGIRPGPKFLTVSRLSPGDLNPAHAWSKFNRNSHLVLGGSPAVLPGPTTDDKDASKFVLRVRLGLGIKGNYKNVYIFNLYPPLK